MYSYTGLTCVWAWRRRQQYQVKLLQHLHLRMIQLQLQCCALNADDSSAAVAGHNSASGF